MVFEQIFLMMIYVRCLIENENFGSAFISRFKLIHLLFNNPNSEHSEETKVIQKEVVMMLDNNSGSNDIGYYLKSINSDLSKSLLTNMEQQKIVFAPIWTEELQMKKQFTYNYYTMYYGLWYPLTIFKMILNRKVEDKESVETIILNKIKNIDEAIYYVQNTLKNGISRNVLIHQIESNLFERNGKALTNFENTLPPLQSDLAKEITKDPYIFDFITLTDDYQERELEDALTQNITNFLLELGSGFAFVGRQYKLIVGGDEFKIDLLFYHIKLKCYVVVELKATSFKPEHAGKLSFYTSAIDGELKNSDDNPTIGILICKSKNNTVVEYALKDINKPLGISEYQLTEILPKEFKSSLPSIEEIEAELSGEITAQNAENEQA